MRLRTNRRVSYWRKLFSWLFAQQTEEPVIPFSEAMVLFEIVVGFSLIYVTFSATDTVAVCCLQTNWQLFLFQEDVTLKKLWLPLFCCRCLLKDIQVQPCSCAVWSQFLVSITILKPGHQFSITDHTTLQGCSGWKICSCHHLFAMPSRLTMLVKALRCVFNRGPNVLSCVLLCLWGKGEFETFSETPAKLVDLPDASLQREMFFFRCKVGRIFFWMDRRTGLVSSTEGSILDCGPRLLVPFQNGGGGSKLDEQTLAHSEFIWESL